MTQSEKALKYFRERKNCAQAILCAHVVGRGMDEEQALAVAVGFGAGMGKEQSVCGAVTGAVMALGLSHFNPEDPVQSKNRVYDITRKFIQKFKDRLGTTECLRLLGVDIQSAEGHDFAKSHDLFTVKCEKYVAEACEILEGLLE
jgi:C_GCAxxG_C_C family probable redox protein